MYDAQWDLKGFERAIGLMKSLPMEMRAKPGRSALGKAARVLTTHAKDNAQRIDDKDTGRKIADNVTQRFRSKYFKQTGDLMISVGVATDKGRIPKGNPDEGPGGNTPHWHLKELGTERMRAEPFLRPAFVQGVEEVQSVFAAELEKQIDKITGKSK